MRIFVLFNLKPGTDVKAYEEWAAKTDIPIVRGLGSIADFRLHAATGLLGSDGASPYEYFEVIDVADMDAFGKDVASETMQRVSAEFQSFADNPLFVTTREVASAS